MREHWRSVLLLLSTAWGTDRWQSLGLLLEPIGNLRYALFAWCLKLITDGALTNDRQLMMAGALGLAATRVLWFVGMWTGSWIRIGLAERVGLVFDREIAAVAAELRGLEHHERPDVQDRLELLRDAHGTLGNSLNSLLNTINAVATGVGTLAALAFAHGWLLLLVPFALPAVPISMMRQRWLREAEERFGSLSRQFRHLRSLTVDRDAGMEIRVFGLQQEMLSRIRRAWVESQGALMLAERRAAVLDSAGDLLFLAGFTAAMILMLRWAHMGLLTVGDVVMTVYLCQQVKGSVAGSVQSVALLSRALRAAARMLWLQDYAREAVRHLASGDRPAPERLRDGIVFERVSFCYPGTNHWVLRDVSFRMPAGTVIALVGENGAGKTTLVKLLCRMYEPTSGRILIDGVDLAELDVDKWRARLTAAFQDFARLEMLLQRSVGVGDITRLDEAPAAQEALRRAGSLDVLRTLPNGLETMLGAQWPGGVNLSTGQWQKLALGRALMRQDPLVVFFDEPTASLDALAEHALFERYAQAAGFSSAQGAITVLVSHRFSTVRSADLIVVTDHGSIVELGGHDELVKRRGLYAELYGLQARSYA
jgi:ATP-binding cassette, subfamily B, bacterial